MTPKKIAILTDSCADLSAQSAKENNIYIVPMRIRCGDSEFRDGIDICPQEVYRRLRAGELPKTSLPSGEDIETVLDRIAADGYDGCVALMLSGGLSGTCNVMRLMAEERSDITVQVYDTKSGSIAIGMTALQLAEDIRGGMGWEELTQRRVPQLIANTYPVFSVDTLEYLMKGGRIGKVTAAAGTLLQIKPLLCFAEDGQLEMVSKVRGRKQVQDKLVELVSTRCGSHKRYNWGVANGGAPEEMAQLREKMAAALPDYSHIWEGEIDSTLSVYIGDGILGACIQILDE